MHGAWLALLSVVGWSRMEGEMEAVLEKPVRTRWLFHARAYGNPRPECAQIGVRLPRGGATVAVHYDGTEFVAAVAVCSAQDNYCKRVGAGIAWTRVESMLAGKGVRNATRDHIADSPAEAALIALEDIILSRSLHRGPLEVRWYEEHVVMPFERRIHNASA